MVPVHVRFLTCVVYVCVCVSPGETESNESGPEVPPFRLMSPGSQVWIRYGTTQLDSTRGHAWRKLVVVRSGHVSETEYSNSTDPSKVGFWCVQPPDMTLQKFFLKERIIEIMNCIPFEDFE